MSGRRLKILHIAVHLGGGIGKAVIGLIRCLGDAAESSIATLEATRDSYYIRLAHEAGIPIVQYSDAASMSEALTDADLAILNWWGHPSTVRLLYEFPDTPCRVVIWSHVNGRTYPYLPGRFLDAFQGVLFSSAYSFDNPLWTVRERERIAAKAQLVYGMGDFDAGQVTPKTKYAVHDRLVIGYVGTLNYAKLAPDFLDYCRAVIATSGNVLFRMAGNPSPELEEDIRAAGLEEYFELAGYVEDPACYERDFDIFGYLLNGDSYATTENALLEAMACALPIVARDNPVERHIIRQGQNGWLVRDSKEYAERIGVLTVSEQARRDLGQSARAFAIKHYSPQNNAERFMAFCRDIVQSSERSRFQFADYMGASPFAAFCFFAADDGIDFAEFGRYQGQAQRRRIADCKPIYREQEKGSVYQYARYFPEEHRFREIIRAWETA